MEVIYDPNNLTAADPATIEYIYRDVSGTYSSGPIGFDQGNPAEDPPYGLWGILNDARVGGFYQAMTGGHGGGFGEISFENMTFSAQLEQPVPEPTTMLLSVLVCLDFGDSGGSLESKSIYNLRRKRQGR